MKISELAKKVGISAHTLRYYEKAGLLSPSQRNQNNYREYTQEDVATTKFILACKESGFSLAETSALLAIKDNKDQHACAEAKLITRNKIEEISQQISQLKNMQTTLIDLEKYCCGGPESAEFCTIISTLEGDS
ncbi:MAG: MerR family transcriptional regulator [Paraglaciecola sp.]|uniref:MerR family transcriptional regulator n=1 Tax=Pseudomonadati TaxID=3379134 RepID=UPI00273DE28A|nr:MerR family transcriptional regulator [Paraglaciecola sp.]MDP5030158.1 MerR family transcriptional regulator [Paraglaciecola sp.]MDP5041758.1 MerR family transcriptional regulator [Paraglaciecola sp.]MDP5130429.1 MerR family transcriptional regulator [Paraglaciecola sp.]